MGGENRIEKIKRIWKDMHGCLVSCFYWDNATEMRYDYNAKTDSIDCECGISISIKDIPTELLTEDSLVKKIDELELKVYDEYLEKRHINLGLKSYCD